MVFFGARENLGKRGNEPRENLEPTEKERYDQGSSIVRCKSLSCASNHNQPGSNIYEVTLLHNRPKLNPNTRQREPERDPLLNTRIGNYEIIARIGQGGMGNVYLGEHPIIRKKVAVKVLREDTSYRPEAVQRFWAEARMISQISHPNVVAVSDFGETPLGQFYFVMEYLDGKPLSAILKEEGVFSTARGIHILAQVAKGLSGAHAKGVIHRDLKPDNILLIDKSPEPELVKILDFGVAKLADLSSERDEMQPRVKTEWGTVLGTPAYMSPEQASGEELDARNDLYSLGIIAYELFTGDVPFKADTLGKLIHKHVHEIPVPPRRKNPEIFKELEDVILRCLEKRPNRRPSSAAEVARIFDALAEEVGEGQEDSTNVQIPLAARKDTQPPMAAHLASNEPDTARGPYEPLDFEESTTKTPASLMEELNAMKSGRQPAAKLPPNGKADPVTARAPVPEEISRAGSYANDLNPQTSKSPQLIKELLFEDSEVIRRQENQGEQTRIAPKAPSETRSLRPLGKEQSQSGPNQKPKRPLTQDDDTTSIPGPKRAELERQKTDPEQPFHEKVRGRGFAKEPIVNHPSPENEAVIVPVPPSTWEDTSLESLRPQKSAAYRAPVPAAVSESGSWDDTAIREESDPGWAQIPTRIAKEGGSAALLPSVEPKAKNPKSAESKPTKSQPLPAQAKAEPVRPAPERPKTNDNWDAIPTSMVPSPLDQSRSAFAKNNNNGHMRTPSKLEVAKPASAYKAKAFSSEDFDSTEYPTRSPTGAAPIVPLPTAIKPAAPRPTEPPVDEDYIKTLRPDDDYMKTLRPPDQMQVDDDEDEQIKTLRPEDDYIKQRVANERKAREPLEDPNESQMRTALRPELPSAPPLPPPPVQVTAPPKPRPAATATQAESEAAPVKRSAPAPEPPRVLPPEPKRVPDRQRTMAADPLPPKPPEAPKFEAPKPRPIEAAPLPAPPVPPASKDEFVLPEPGPISLALANAAMAAPAGEFADAAKLAGKARRRLMFMAIIVGALAATVVAMLLARYLKTPKKIDIAAIPAISKKASNNTIDITQKGPDNAPVSAPNTPNTTLPNASMATTPETPATPEVPLDDRVAIYIDPDKANCAKSVLASSETGSSSQIQSTIPYKPLRADVTYTFTAEGFQEQKYNLSKIKGNELKLCLLPEEEKPDPKPTKNQPKKVEPKKVEPKKVEPKKVEPKKVEPKKVEPKKVEPKNERTGKSSNPEL
jgi:serine/threonine protein kinase